MMSDRTLSTSTCSDPTTSRSRRRWNSTSTPSAISLAPSGRFGLTWESSFNELQGHTIQLVDVEAGGGLWQAELPGQISDESFSPSDALVAVSELGGGVHVYDTATGSLTSSFSPGTGAVTSVSFLDEQRLAIATTDGVEVRDLTNGGRWEQQITVRAAPKRSGHSGHSS